MTDFQFDPTHYAHKSSILYDIREKVDEAKDKIRDCFFSGVEFAINHPEETAVIVGVIGFSLRKADKYMDIWREERLRNSMIYDRSLGMYWQTRKPLTANQRLIIESRHKAGEPYGKILSDMKVLKR